MPSTIPSTSGALGSSGPSALGSFCASGTLGSLSSSGPSASCALGALAQVH